MDVCEYCISTRELGGHYLVHNVQRCDDMHLPAPENRVGLGHYYSPQLALERAREFLTNAQCCAYCCSDNLE